MAGKGRGKQSKVKGKYGSMEVKRCLVGWLVGLRRKGFQQIAWAELHQIVQRGSCGGFIQDFNKLLLEAFIL